MQDIESFRERLQSLITKFEKDKPHYRSKGYPEAQLRIDFLNPLFKTLGWDIENKAQKSPHERDVIVELSPETTGRPDYNFRINGATKFFVEAKAPSVALDDINNILQAKSYAWSTKEVYFVILTDFEEFKLFDASLKPNPRFPDEGLIFALKYTDYIDKIEKLWELSRERVEQGSLESLLPKDTKSKRLRIPPDKSFLEDLTIWRTELAKDIHKRNPEFDVKVLNDVVQRLLDRIIFIRIAEDRKIRPERELWEIVAQWKEEGKRKSIMTHLAGLFHEVNADLNGDIFKPHACETADVDSGLLAEIIENLYFPKSRYRFDAIGVELLGSIYERYLGSTIRVTPQRVKVEEKPEVRKAGGVYYTPKYIVDYIVKNTVGKLIEGKTPRQIEKIKILDPACGSGSFLLGAYQYLIDYHLKYYREHPKEAQTLHLFPYYKISPEELTLPLHEKAKILRNNIFGVDIDPQAVEITMMSLYLKALEGERGVLPKKQHLLPPLSNNIKCGNSLIGYDIFDTPTLPFPSPQSSPLWGEEDSFIPSPPGERRVPIQRMGGVRGRVDDETKSRINPFDWNSKTAGFGEIMESGGFDVVIGNPPYIFTRDRGLTPEEKNYYYSHYHYQGMQLNTFGLFLEKSFRLLNTNGSLGFITPSNWLTIDSFVKLRKFYIEQRGALKIYNNLEKVFESANVDTVIVFYERGKKVTPIVGELFYGNETFSKTLSHKTISAQDYILGISQVKEDGILSIVSKVKKQGAYLSQIATVSTGLKAYQTGKGKPKQKDFVKKERIFHSTVLRNKTYKKYLDGKDVIRYYLGWSKEYLSYGDWLAEPRRSIPFQGERILIRQIPSSPPYCIHAVYTEEECLNDINSMVVFNISGGYNYYYLLGILNSRLLSFWFQKSFDKLQRKIFPQFKVKELAKFPIRTIDFNKPSEKVIHDKLVALVDRMLELHKKKNTLPLSTEREKVEREIAVTDEKIDEIVYGLYGVTDEERKIIEGDFKGRLG